MTDNNRERAIDLAVSQIEKQFGKGSIMRLGEDVVLPGIQSISTGALSEPARNSNERSRASWDSMPVIWNLAPNTP